VGVEAELMEGIEKRVAWDGAGLGRDGARVEAGDRER
jgi:hypothetical protein